MHAHPSPVGGRAGPGRLAALFRRSGAAFLRDHRLPSQQARVLHAISICRTEAAGLHLNACEVCGHTEVAANSCGNRHCPTCQWSRQQDWIADRLARMLPVPHFHVVFTVPEELRPLAAFNAEVFYDRLLRAAAETLKTLAADRLGILPGITVVLHTWTRALLRHPHVHCIVTAGGEDLALGGWKPIDRAFLLPAAVMAGLFRGKLLALLKAADRRQPLVLPDPQPLRALLAPLYKKRWVVYAKAPLHDRRHLVRYLGAYTHRVAISEGRIAALGDHDVTFRTRRQRTVTLSDQQFLDRFRMHVLPKGFRKVRHFGLYAPGNTLRLLAVGESHAEQLPDLPRHSDAMPRARRGRICPVCAQGVLTFIRFLPEGATFLDSS